MRWSFSLFVSVFGFVFFFIFFPSCSENDDKNIHNEDVRFDPRMASLSKSMMINGLEHIETFASVSIGVELEQWLVLADDDDDDEQSRSLLLRLGDAMMSDETGGIRLHRWRRELVHIESSWWLITNEFQFIIENDVHNRSAIEGMIINLSRDELIAISNVEEVWAPGAVHPRYSDVRCNMCNDFPLSHTHRHQHRHTYSFISV